MYLFARKWLGFIYLAPNVPMMPFKHDDVMAEYIYPLRYQGN
jgi:hypothetical protein